jgi:hypothetical protein
MQLTYNAKGQWVIPLAVICFFCRWLYGTRSIHNRENTPLLPLFRDTGLRISATGEVCITRYASRPLYTSCCSRAGRKKLRGVPCGVPYGAACKVTVGGAVLPADDMEAFGYKADT